MKKRGIWVASLFLLGFLFSNLISYQQAFGQTTNDDVPSISINDVSVIEGDDNVVVAMFTVTLSEPSQNVITVDYSTADGPQTGGAMAGEDYMAATGQLVFFPNDISKTIEIFVNGDRTFETSDPQDPTNPAKRFEIFFVNLSNNSPGTSITDNQGIATINDADLLPSIFINDVTVTEGNSDTTDAVFTVSLSAASSVPIMVTVTTQDGTATVGPSPTIGNDYNFFTTTLTFEPGETTKPFTVTVNGDLSTEFDEIFLVNLSDPVIATIGDPQGVGTIANDDDLPILRISDATVLEGDTGTIEAVFTVDLTNSAGEVITSGQIVIVNFATADGTGTSPATSESDYVATSGTLIFSQGESTKEIHVTVNPDNLNEATENFFVNLSNPTNAVIGDGQGNGTILDNDQNLADFFQFQFLFPGKNVPAFTDPSSIEFSFNPREYIVLKKVPWKNHDTPSVDNPNFEFTIGEPMKMKMDIFLDTSNEGTDVDEYVNKIQSLAQIDTQKPKPPQCVFVWGSFEYKCVLESFTIKYTKFLPDGTPVRAIMNLDLKEVKPSEERLNSYTLKKHEALELLDASNESIPLLRSYQTSSFHDVVDQLFGDLVEDDDLPPVDDVSLDDTLTNSLDFLELDVPVIVKGFKIEIKGQKQGQSEDNEWKTVSGGTLNIEIADSSVGTDQFHTTTPGHKFIDELTLKGPMTDKRKPLSDWISDGSLDKCNECKNMTFLFFDENGNKVSENQIRVIDSYYFRNQVFLLSIQDDNRLHATVLDVARTDSSGNQYTGAPRIFVVLPTSSPSFMPVGIGGSGFAVPTVPYVNGVPSISIFNFQIQNIPLIGSISVGFTIVPPAAPSGQSNLQVEYLGQRSNPFPFSVN